MVGSRWSRLKGFFRQPKRAIAVALAWIVVTYVLTFPFRVAEDVALDWAKAQLGENREDWEEVIVTVLPIVVGWVFPIALAAGVLWVVFLIGRRSAPLRRLQQVVIRGNQPAATGGVRRIGTTSITDEYGTRNEPTFSNEGAPFDFPSDKITIRHTSSHTPGHVTFTGRGVGQREINCENRPKAIRLIYDNNTVAEFIGESDLPKALAIRGGELTVTRFTSYGFDVDESAELAGVEFKVDVHYPAPNEPG